MHTWIDIATLTKKRNAQGRFVARCQANLLLCLRPGMRVAFVPPVLDAPRNAHILEVSKTSETTLDITFEYSDGPWESVQEDELVGLHCLVLRSEIDAEIMSSTDDSLVGYEVFDEEHGSIGIVQEEVHNPGQSLLVVARTTGEADVMIPHVAPIVTRIDTDCRTIQVELPVGLLDL